MNYDNQGVIVPDVSFWQDDDSTPQKVDFTKMRAAGAEGVIIRAGQNTWLDEDFADYWRAARASGLPRGSYWFYDSRSSPESQANRWKFALDGDMPELGLWVDLEENYNGVYRGERYWKTFIETVKTLCPGVKVGIYTSYGWWTNQIIADPGYFANFPLWLAWYTSNPANVAVPRPWTASVLWQFSSTGDGARYGVESSEIDLSVWNGSLESFKSYFNLGSSPVALARPYPGVEYYKGAVNGVNYYVLLIDMQGKRAKIVYDPNLKTVSQFAIENNAQIAVNGNEWYWRTNPPYLPAGITVSDGRVIVNEFSGEPFLNITQDNQLSLPWNDYSDLYNAVSGFRFIVDNGINIVPQNNTDPKYTELHARSAKGIHRDGRLMIVGTDGTPDMRTGTTLSMLADLFVQYGARRAMDNDSGGSFALRIGNEIVNRPSDGHEREVVTALLLFAGGTTMQQWKITWPDGARLRVGPGVSYNAAPITSNILAINTVANVQQIQVNTAGVDEWAQHENGYWFATIYNGQARAVNVTPPPPSSELPPTLEHTAVFKDAFGNVLATYKGTLTKQ